MNDTQIPALDHTIQQTNSWLKTLVSEHHFGDRHDAYNALRAVIQALRDQLSTEQALHLSAQFPILIRGFYAEGWHIAPDRTAARTIEEFVQEVERRLPLQFPRDPISTSEAVFHLLWKELDPGMVTKVIGWLPVPLHALWPAIARSSYAAA